MVWQSNSAHASSPDGSNGGPQALQGNGNGNGNGSGPGSQGPLGTEYTLQGVMRFLQTEWHRHERDRNSWEIERAEMKARVARLEGELHAEKRSSQVFNSRIRVLEMVLKQERAKSAMAAAAGTTGQEAKKAGSENVLPGVSNILEEIQNLEASDMYRDDGSQDKVRAFVDRVLREVQYLMTPSNHPPPPQPGSAAGSPYAQPQGQPTDHSLLQQSGYQPLSQPSPSPNHQPPPPPTSTDNISSNMGISIRGQSMRSQQSPYSAESRLQMNQPAISIPSMSPAESADHIPPQYNAYNSEFAKKDTNPFSNAAMESSMRGEESGTSVGEDAWDFDDKAPEPTPEDPFSKSVFSDLGDYDSQRKSLHSSRRKLSLSKRRVSGGSLNALKQDGSAFKVKFALRGHLDVVRALVFTGGGTKQEPEICTAGDDGVLKRWYIPGGYNLATGADVDVTSHFTHRGHAGIVTSLAAAPANAESGEGEGWIFSGGQDATVKVWETGKVASIATLIGHTDAVWAVCVLPSSSALVGHRSPDGANDRVLLASGSADGTVKIWSVSTPPQIPSRPSSVASSLRRSFGSQYGAPRSPSWAFSYTLLATIQRPECTASPTCITPMSITGESFVVSYNDASVVIFDTASGEEVVSMMSQETYDGEPKTGVSSVVATTMTLDTAQEVGKEEEFLVAGATGQKGGVGGMVITGHEDQYVRIFDANSGQCTYTMLAHPAAIASLALSPDGRELVSAGHDASLRFWSMEKRSCTQEITTHRLMRGEGVCAVVWSKDGRWVVSGGGDGVVKVYSR